MIKTIIIKAARLIESVFYRLQQCFGPYERTRKYKGFDLAYTRGYSLVSRITRGREYEPELCLAITDELRKTKSAFFLDVGANIGLVSLNVLSEIPDLAVFCIEPGPEQSGQLKKTVALNNLARNVKVFQLALGERKGELQFAVHASVHTSSDGFFDTRRAGRARAITVAVDTLDNWWRSAGRPCIKVVKIDTEGAELWVLRGAEEFMGHCRPVLFLEINERNIEPYPYRRNDLIKWLRARRYCIKTLDGSRIDGAEPEPGRIKTDTFIAISEENDTR
jgi:FkbM family methyltransferase